jgi:hypothetical protein
MQFLANILPINLTMNSEIKSYVAMIGRRGGAARNEAKAVAVRRNGTLGGRPRKDGAPAGSRCLTEMLHAIETSALPTGLKAELTLWMNANAVRFRDGRAFVLRNDVVRTEAMLRHWSENRL